MRLALSNFRIAQAIAGRLPRLSFGAAILVGAACVIAAVLTITMMVFWQAGERYTENARTSSRNVALLVEEQTTRGLNSVDVVLRAAGRLASGRTSEPQRAAAEALLSELLAGAPLLRGVQVFSPQDGRVLLQAGGLLSSAPEVLAEALATDRERSEPGLRIGRPVEERGTRLWTLGVSRRLPGPGEPLVAVAHLALDPSSGSTSRWISAQAAPSSFTGPTARC